MFDAQAGQEHKEGRVGALQVAQDRACRANRRRHGCAAESGQRVNAKVRAEHVPATPGLPAPGLEPGQVPGQDVPLWLRDVVRDQRLGRVDARDFFRESRARILSGELRDRELTGADIDPGQAPARAVVMQGSEVAALPCW